MEKDTLATRGQKAFVFTNLKAEEGLSEVVDWIKKEVFLEGLTTL